MPYASAYATGPRTEAGKAVASRNATTHGVFCRQTVLPHLGEDPQAYQRLLDTLHEQLRPRNLMERQYIELWADASWKLRRFSRLEAQAWEDPRLSEDTRLTKLERLSRLQNTLRRQMDKAVKMLLGDVHDLHESRAREDVMTQMQWTEASCRDRFNAGQVEKQVQAHRQWPLDEAALCEGVDTPPPPPPVPAPPQETKPKRGNSRRKNSKTDNSKNCQNELPKAEPAQAELPEEDRPEEPQEKCQNELSAPEENGEWTEADWDVAYPLTDKEQREREIQALEDRVNGDTLTSQEKLALLMNSNIPGWSKTPGKGYILHRK